MPRRKKTTPTTPLLQTLQELRTNIEKLKTSATHRTKEITFLLKREEMLAKVFRLIPDMIIVTELQSGIIVDVNDRYGEVMGYRRDELIGSSTLDLKSWHCPEDRNTFTTLLATDTACREFKTTLCTKSGTRIPVMISARILELENTPCIVSIVQDITELHQKEQALEYRISLERLVASVSTHFLTMRSGDLDRGIVQALEMIGTFAGADRCSVWQCMPDGSRIDATHEWYGAGLPPLLHRRTAISLSEQLPALAQHILKGTTYTLPAARSAEASFDADESFFSAQGTAMLVAVPMRYGGQPTMLVSCEKNTPSPWPGDLPALLKIASEIFMSAMVRARNERDLRDSEQRFRSLFDNAQDGMLVVDPERLRFMTANRSFIKMLGYSAKELQTLSVKDIHPPEQLPPLVERYHVAATGSTVRAEAVPVIRKDSTTFLADMVLSTVILDNRPYLLGVFRDMTEQLTVETERLRLFTAVEQATEFIAILGADGSFQYINPAGQHMFGYTMEEVYGKNAFATDKGIYDPAFYRAIWDDLRSGKAWSGRLTYQSKDGTIREIEQNISPVKDRNGSIICFLSIGRDITNEVRLEQALRHAQKMEAIGTLSSGIAHDFNNILSVITGYAQMLLSSSAENSPEEANLVEILRAGRRARDLVRQILTFSRQTEQERQPLHIAPIIKETLRFLRASLPTSIVIEQDIATDTDIILTDPTQIHQIMMNLCTNAAHAMKERGGTLRVTVAPRELTEREAQELPELPLGHYLTLSVSDTGHGIRADIIERIFDPYFTTKPQGEGTGLGTFGGARYRKTARWCNQGFQHRGARHHV
jgi:PAS domain S-box-containing protein